MEPQALESKLLSAFPDARVNVRDLTGTGDHWEARIVSSAFEGRSLVDRHRLVYGALVSEMAGPIHALTLQTLTPAEAGG